VLNTKNDTVSVIDTTTKTVIGSPIPSICRYLVNFLIILLHVILIVYKVKKIKVKNDPKTTEPEIKLLSLVTTFF